jgi:hypothetical protein
MANGLRELGTGSCRDVAKANTLRERLAKGFDAAKDLLTKMKARIK